MWTAFYISIGAVVVLVGVGVIIRVLTSGLRSGPWWR